MLPILCALLTAVSDPTQGLVVHEWGTFTSVSAADGSKIRFQHRSDPLPSFVQGMGKWGEHLIRMETPVVYFYTDTEQKVSLSVAFPSGMMTEWFPNAIVDERGIHWSNVKLLPGTDLDLPTKSSPSRYYAARHTDAVALQVPVGDALENEKFLFYRGLGDFAPSIDVTMVGDSVQITSTDTTSPIPQVILFEKRGERIAFQKHGALEAGARTLLIRKTPNGGMGTLREDLIRSLVEQGLYEKEASAMLATWDESWFEEGLRIVYLVPRTMIDAVVPMSIEPKPQDLQRVFVGRVEILTPEFERLVEREVRDLNSGDAGELFDLLDKHGRFAHAALKHAMSVSADASLKNRFPWFVGGE